jgi:glycosyltransferase involved in cell wall biosynthesis
VTHFSLVLVDMEGRAFFASAEREALRGMGETANVVYVRRPQPGDDDGHDAGEIIMGRHESLLACIRAGVERALCPHVAVLEVSGLTSYAGAAALALELTRHDDSERDEDFVDSVDFVAGQVIDSDGVVLFRDAALGLDGGIRLGRGGLPSEVRGHRPTLLCDPRAFAAKRELLLASWKGDPLSRDRAAPGELPWRCWLLGGRAVSSRSVSVVAEQQRLPVEPRAWKPSLGRLLSDEYLARTPEGVDVGPSFDPVRTARRLLRAGGLLAPEIEEAMALRREIQERRTRPDIELSWDGLLGDPATSNELPVEGRLRVAILCSDAVGISMAGPAIRSIELARAIGTVADVRIAARLGGGLPAALPCPLHDLTDGTVAELLEWADAMVVQGPLTDWHRDVLRSGIPLAVDLYDPMNLEALESVDPDALVPYTTNLLRDQLWRGDFFFCASERQRDFWLGMLAGCGRVTPGRYAEDPDLLGLIDVVPYGIPAEEPARSGPGVRAELGIGAEDPLFVWNGGIWQWFDPDLLVGAVARLKDELPNVRALFMGIQRPGSRLTEEARRLVELIDELGLRDDTVFVRDWTPYGERADTYLDATAIVSLHHAHVETRFSFRTRLLDCIWAATPVICTTGDVLAPIVRDEQIGITVPPGDLDAIVDALRTLATDREGVAAMRGRLRALASQYHWEVAAAPLVRWCVTSPTRREERFAVGGLDPGLTRLTPLAPPGLGLKALVPRPIRQYVLGPLKRRLLQS